MRILALSLLLLAGCSKIDEAMSNSANPLARASNKSVAMVTIIACPLAPRGAIILQEILATMQQNGEIAIATSGGTARVIIDTCPPGSAERLTADLLVAAQRRR